MSILRRLFGKTVPPLVPEAGDLLSVETEDGFGVIKVLAVQREGVHARLYEQRFPHRPSAEELPELTIGGFDPDAGTPFSIGHIPLSQATFAGWKPEKICAGRVAGEELDGYSQWADARGGFF